MASVGKIHRYARAVRAPLLLLCLAVLLAITGTALGGEGQPSQTHTPSDVYARVALVRAELETLRYHMGKPRNEQPEIDIRQAAPREVYFQALALFRGANRLSFEHTRERAAEPTPPTGKIAAADVYHVVDAVLERLRHVQQTYGIEAPGEVSVPAEKTSSDVFRAVVQANRQLNLLLDYQVAPSDVFQQVTLAVGYGSSLLAHFPEAITLPAEPAFEAAKRPGDVYRRLLRCLNHIHEIADTSGLPILHLEADEQQIVEAEPSDVYHLASLVVAELAFLHAQNLDPKPPRDVYYVGRKFPSHVYQRAGILERQLIELERRVKQNPGWLAARGFFP